ncbi:Bll5268 protein [Olavius algarvensis associated proteobacterium Delta 3]|nr:Bll5268 protein [Olavius algarvensis associated proteobacterium Delta 3]CAB5173068.1 Bll5268 protein [Olavius algarvensis associated proteobacterium Delta 3]
MNLFECTNCLHPAFFENTPDKLDRFRTVFGDERVGYRDSLKKYYSDGPPNDWREHYVSAYSTAHPWEEWAETWAHYMHLVDSLETAYALGLTLHPRVKNRDKIRMEANFDPYSSHAFDPIVDACLPLVLAINSINRSMGQPDLYPFVVPSDVLGKLRFIHKIIHEHRA